MEMLFTKELTIPLYQMGLLLVSCTLILFIGRAKTALLINYLFLFYWAYWLNKDLLFGPGIPAINVFTLGIYGFSALTFILALIGFLHRPA